MNKIIYMNKNFNHDEESPQNIYKFLILKE